LQERFLEEVSITPRCIYCSFNFSYKHFLWCECIVFTLLGDSTQPGFSIVLVATPSLVATFDAEDLYP
jgi:hypothetical protein